MTVTLKTQTAKQQQPTQSLQAIKDKTDLKNQGIILLRQSTLQAIYEKSGALAKSNEFQTHYWYLNLRYIAEDNSILDIAIPTCFFNYKQTVSSASIDFELTDVIEVSNKVLPIHNVKVNQILKSGFIELVESLLRVKFQASSQAYGSIHRHPGSSRSQSFSGTDLCKTAAEPGVVFPFQSADNTPNFAGIMAIDNGQNRVARFEYRVATGTLGTDITYTKGGCIAYILDDTQSKSKITDLLKMSKPKDYTFCSHEDTTAVTDEIFNVFRHINFTPSVDAVSDIYLSKPEYATRNYFGSPYTSVRTTTYKGAEEYSDAKAVLEHYKHTTIYEKNEVMKWPESRLKNETIALSKIYHSDSTPVFHEETALLIKTMPYEETVEEYMFYRDCVIEEYTAAEKIVTEYENSNATDKMATELIHYGVPKSTILTSSKAKVEEWYKNLTGE